jgi:hypothetical protein
MTNELKRFIKSLLDISLRGYSRVHQKDRSPGDAIFLTGAPRSGTTWVYEIFTALLNSSFGMWEPLNPRNYKILKRFDQPLRPYLNPAMKDQDLYHFFEALLKGQLYQTSTMENFNLQRFFQVARSSDPLIIKSVRGNRVLPWITENFPLKNAYLLLRHPCAVISSQLKHGSWDYVKREKNLKHPKIVREMLDNLPEIKEMLYQELRPEEKLAITWGFDYYVPLKYSRDNNFHLIFYEDLVRNGTEALEPILEKFGVSPSNVDLNAVLNKKSRTTKDDETDKVNQLSKWKYDLSEEQIERILKIVNYFGLDFYDRDAKPNMNKIQTTQNPFS